MKTPLLLHYAAVAGIVLSVAGFNAYADPGQSGSSQAPLSPATTESDPDVRDPSPRSSHDGVAIIDDTYYLIRNHVASRLDVAALTEEQMLADDGRFVPIPEDVVGLGVEGGVRATAKAKGTSGPSSTAGLEAGVVKRSDRIYVVSNGRAMQVDVETKKGQMLTFLGKVISIPEGISGLTDGPILSANQTTSSKVINPSNPGGTPNSGKPAARP